MSASRARFADGRLHFQHGPIDIIVGAEGDPCAVRAAHLAAWERFEQVLAELVSELPLLRKPVELPVFPGDAAPGVRNPLRGPIARRMWTACSPFARETITPMAAVAGSVAEELIAHYQREGVSRAWVNNGGDIAWHLARDAAPFRIGLVADLGKFDAPTPRCDGRLTVTADMPARGIATSGWRGRSFSLGIADSVTVLAHTAAQADAAATVIANAVDIDDSRIVRRPACEMKDDSDLGERLVTVQVPSLEPDRISRALARGRNRARELRDSGLILGCTLVLQKRFIELDHDARQIETAIA